MADSSLSPLLFLLCVSSLSVLRSAAASSVCPRSDIASLHGVSSQCPLEIDRSPPMEVSGETVDEVLSHGGRDAYYSILFYASWCPFSSRTRPIFDALSSMFPQITHLQVEESSAMPCVFSRAGVHSFPAIILTNRKSTVRYHGSKDLDSLLQFYRETTGLEPVSYLAIEHSNDYGPHVPSRRSVMDIVWNEPIMAFGLLFICLRALAYFLPVISSSLKAIWVSRFRHLDAGIFHEPTQMLKRALQLIDVKRLWGKIRLCNKSTKFQMGAKNARVWASSLASVSLGDASSSRLGPSVS